MLPPSFLILPGCCLLAAPLLSPVSPWDRRCLSAAALQSFRSAAAPALTASRAPHPPRTRKLLAWDTGAAGTLAGPSSPPTPALCRGRVRLLLTAAKPCLGLPPGKCFQPVPALPQMGARGHFVRARGARPRLGVRRQPQRVGTAACGWRSWGPKVLIPVLVAGSAWCRPLCLLRSHQQKTWSWPGPHAREGKSNLRILAGTGRGWPGTCMPLHCPGGCSSIRALSSHLIVLEHPPWPGGCLGGLEEGGEARAEPDLGRPRGRLQQRRHNLIPSLWS